MPSEPTTASAVFVWLWLMAGADLLWENSTADYLLAHLFFPIESRTPSPFLFLFFFLTDGHSLRRHPWLHVNYSRFWRKDIWAGSWRRCPFLQLSEPESQRFMAAVVRAANEVAACCGWFAARSPPRRAIERWKSQSLTMTAMSRAEQTSA